jgi:hypothetical protein
MDQGLPILITESERVHYADIQWQLNKHKLH